MELVSRRVMQYKRKVKVQSQEWNVRDPASRLDESPVLEGGEAVFEEVPLWLDRSPTLRQLVAQLNVHLSSELDPLLPDFLTGEAGEDLLLLGEGALGDELVTEVGGFAELLLEGGKDGDGLVEAFEAEGFGTDGGLIGERGQVERRKGRQGG
jgi:hypothetical protein